MPYSKKRTYRQQRGDAAESSAARFLESHGLVVLERSFRRRFGELDLVCVDPEDGSIVFVEVRYRSSDSHGGPLASVTPHKALRLRKTAAAWLQRNADPRRRARIDVIGICPAAQRLTDTMINPVVLWEEQQLCWLLSVC